MEINACNFCILQTIIESLKPFIVSGVWWSVKLVLPTETQKLHFCVCSWALLTSFQMGANRHSGIIMSLFLLVAETNRHLKNSYVYKKCQIELLKEEIKWKQKSISTLKKDPLRVKEELQGAFFVLRFFLLCFLFLVANDKSILQHDNIQKWNLQNLSKISSNNIFSDSHNPERVFFNISSYELADDEKNVLCKGLNFLDWFSTLVQYNSVQFLLPCVSYYSATLFMICLQLKLDY